MGIGQIEPNESEEVFSSDKIPGIIARGHTVHLHIKILMALKVINRLTARHAKWGCRSDSANIYIP